MRLSRKPLSSEIKKMKKIRVTYLALVAFASVASCSKEATEPDVYEWTDGKIYFRTSLSDVAYSRAQDMTLDRLESFQVTCFNSADTDKDQAGFIFPYFENATFIRKVNAGTTYVSSPVEEPRDWPENDGLLKFFAFSPSLSVMAAGNSAITDANKQNYFNLTNSSVGNGTTMSVGYRLGSIRINPDISRQIDFITAEVAGERWKDFAGGVELAFSHQLCQVELKAWGDVSDYDFEIAGVRLGNPVVEGSFVFADDSSSKNSPEWEIDGDGIKDKVEYLYGSSLTTDPGIQPDTSERIFRINNIEHNTAESAGSIMGKGGCAMVIPTVNTKWEGSADPDVTATHYKTDRMYFSILMRVTDHLSGNTIYPYPGNPTGMTVVSFALDAEGNILTRLYVGTTADEYFTDSELQHPYVASEGVEIKDFGWAAVPVDADWSAGKRYVYTLNYSEGIGVHDPADPEPGKPIAGSSPIEWGVKVDTWTYAEKDENYDPELNVP